MGVSEAEVFFQKFKESAAPFQEDDRDFSPDEVERLHKEVEEAGAGSKDKIKVCTDFILKNGPMMKEPPPAPGAPPKETSETKKNLSALLARINECTRGQESTMKTSSDKKAKAMKKGEA